MKYYVVTMRAGYIYVEAESKAEAMDIADHQNTNDIIWVDDWDVTDAIEDDSIPDDMCITKKAFD